MKNIYFRKNITYMLQKYYKLVKTLYIGVKIDFGHESVEML